MWDSLASVVQSRRNGEASSIFVYVYGAATVICCLASVGQVEHVKKNKQTNIRAVVFMDKKKSQELQQNLFAISVS